MSKPKRIKREYYSMSSLDLQNGVTYSLANAMSLAEDALELLKAKRSYHVISILEAAVQELGKAVMLQKLSNRIVQLNMSYVMASQTIPFYSIIIGIREFKDHKTKHQLGIPLLAKDATEVLKQEMDYSKMSEGMNPFAIRKHSLSEALRLSNLYVNWLQGEIYGGWELPPMMTLGSFEAPQPIYKSLETTANAIIEAARTFHLKDISH